MADEQKPVEVAETTPAVAEPVSETKPAEDKPAESAPAAEPAVAEAPAETTEAAADASAAAPTEEAKKEEAKPIEAGNLEHKGAPANFPKNLIYSKQHFWFGTDATPKDKLATYLKNEKTAEVAQHVAAWATETGKGLLFYGKESDKTAPTGAIQLAEASEPSTEGTHKFTFTAKGHKHVFKAPTTADRDNWVEQLKLKIAEAKELATTITESETYKQTIESFKPTPPPKEDKPAAEGEAAKEEAKEEPKEEDKKDEPKEEAKEDDKKDSKRRSASRKRASIFGNLLGGKKEEAKKETEDKPAEDKPAETAEAAEPAAETPAVEAPAAEAAPAEEAKKEEPAKPTPSKRASLFGGLSFGKKKVEPESAPATPAKETAGAEAPVAETAPVIPAVETTEPLSTDVASPATAPTETSDATPATNGETKDVKSEKRKSSLPFGFGKKEKAATSDEEGEKVKSPPFFSKLRQTVKGKGKAEKPTEEAKTEDKPAETTEASEPTKEATSEEPTVAAIPEETSAEKPAAAAPAPVTAAA